MHSRPCDHHAASEGYARICPIILSLKNNFWISATPPSAISSHSKMCVFGALCGHRGAYGACGLACAIVISLTNSFWIRVPHHQFPFENVCVWSSVPFQKCYGQLITVFLHFTCNGHIYIQTIGQTAPSATSTSTRQTPANN